jgi:uncharacterized protein (TIGR03083 family)
MEEPTVQTDSDAWLSALRRSHRRLAARTSGLDASGLRAPSYCGDWTIAQVLSHLGSQAVIFGLLLEAGLSGGDPPGQDDFRAIWDAWNARTPEDQAADSVAANDDLVRRLEGLDTDRLRSFHLRAFGGDLDAVGLLRMRLSEHAVHTWDVEVALDPGVTVAADAVALLVDGLPEMAARVGRPAGSTATLLVSTTDPERRFAIVTDGVGLEPWSDRHTSGTLQLPAEALLRLLYGRLDPAHTPPVQLDAPGISLDDLRAVFPGF